MPIYTYHAKRGPKETVTGEIEAVSQEEAVSKLEKMGLVPTKLTEKEKDGEGNRKISFIKAITLPFSLLCIC